MLILNLCLLFCECSSQFVQALLLSTLATSSLDESVPGGRDQKLQPDTERNRSESQETTFSDNNVNIESTSEATKSGGGGGGSSENATDNYGVSGAANSRTASSELNVNNSNVNAVDAAAQTANNEGRQVNQQQQTSPDDLSEDCNSKQQQQQHLHVQQQPQSHTQMYSNKKKSPTVSSNERGIERRGVRPSATMSGGATAVSATSSQPPGTINLGQQHQQAASAAAQKYKQNVAGATNVAMSANANPIPDTR